MLDRLFNWIDTSLAYRFSAALTYRSAVEVCLRFGEAAFSALEGFAHFFPVSSARIRRFIRLAQRAHEELRLFASFPPLPRSSLIFPRLPSVVALQ